MVEDMKEDCDLSSELVIRETQESPPQMDIYRRLQKSRVELCQLKLKKSGVNTAYHYKYYELDDFLPQVQYIMYNNGLCPIFRVTCDEATLEICEFIANDEGVKPSITFRTPIPAISTIANPKVSGCQAIGMLHAYFKRYLYLNALEICESDMHVDGRGGCIDYIEEGRLEETRLEETSEELKKIYEHIHKNPDIKQELLKIETVEDANRLIKTESINQIERRILDKIMRIKFREKVYFDPNKQKYVPSVSQRVKEMVEQMGNEVVQKAAVGR